MYFGRISLVADLARQGRASGPAGVRLVRWNRAPKLKGPQNFYYSVCNTSL